MLAVNATRFYRVCDKYLIRNFITGKRLDIRGPRNPGLDNRLQVFREGGIKFKDKENIEELMEQSESNPYLDDDTYDKHFEETLSGRHELRQKIVKEKYFKENMPNLLTWSEKEQIRHLVMTQPDEWSAQRIAESFPVTEQVVKKLIKYPWKPASEQRIARHDASAMRNWRELKEGTLDIPENLRQHFLQFSNRTIPPTNKISNKVEISNENMGEFETIVRKFAKNETSEEINEDGERQESEPSIKVQRDYKKVTLDVLATKIKTRLEHGQNVDMPDRLMADSLFTDNNTKPKLNNEIEIPNETKEETSLTTFKQSENEVVGVNYPERIRIPKKAYKRGATYKMNDCFYDDDGRFLYRVIGIGDN